MSDTVKISLQKLKKIDNFIDLYNFLGIPPFSPSNLIYLSLQKLESADWNELAKLSNFSTKEEYLKNMEYYIYLVKENLFKNIEKRQEYENEWKSYYFPLKDGVTDISNFDERIKKNELLKIGLRNKTLPLISSEKIQDNFKYTKDFIYYITKDSSRDRNKNILYILDPNEQIQFTPLKDNIIFYKNQFFIQSYGDRGLVIINDAMGKFIILKKKKVRIPLHLGDRIEFENGPKLILKGIYSGIYNKYQFNKSNEKEKLGLYFCREDVVVELDPSKIYIVGRNTSDLHRLPFVENRFCFINIGRQERSISRQNFQIFFYDSNWYIKDLGSRYGTTLDFQDHVKFETLGGGAILKLEKGEIRIGYDKSYIIKVDTLENIKKYRNSHPISYNIKDLKKDTYLNIYNLPLI